MQKPEAYICLGFSIGSSWPQIVSYPVREHGLSFMLVPIEYALAYFMPVTCEDDFFFARVTAVYIRFPCIAKHA